MFQEEICTVFLGIKLYVMLSKYKSLQREFSTYTLLKTFYSNSQEIEPFLFVIQKGNLVFCVEVATGSVQINSKIFMFIKYADEKKYLQVLMPASRETVTNV